MQGCERAEWLSPASAPPRASPHDAGRRGARGRESLTRGARGRGAGEWRRLDVSGRSSWVRNTSTALARLHPHAGFPSATFMSLTGGREPTRPAGNDDDLRPYWGKVDRHAREERREDRFPWPCYSAERSIVAVCARRDGSGNASILPTTNCATTGVGDDVRSARLDDLAAAADAANGPRTTLAGGEPGHCPSPQPPMSCSTLSPSVDALSTTSSK